MGSNVKNILLISPYNSRKVGGIGTWSKSILEYFSSGTEFKIVFQNTTNPIRNNLPRTKIFRILVGIEDTIVVLIKLFFNLCFRDIDVVHYTSSASMALSKDRIIIFVAKQLFHKKFIIHWHFGRIPELAVVRNSEYRKILKIIKKVDASIVLDNKSLYALQAESCQNIYCIPNPITDSVIQAAKNIDAVAIQKDRERGVVLFVGHVIRNKGIYELVTACAQCDLVKRLIVVGPYKQEDKSNLMLLAKIKGDSTWLDFRGELKREDVYDYYKKAAIFCLPSYTEGFPYVILESMAFACPIVSTDVGAIPEMLSEQSGVVINPKDIHGLTFAIENLLHDKSQADSYGINAYKRVMSCYSVESIMTQFANLWRLL